MQFEKMKDMYEQEAKIQEKAMSGVSVPNIEEINSLYDELCRLPITGLILKNAMVLVEAETSFPKSCYCGTRTTGSPKILFDSHSQFAAEIMTLSSKIILGYRHPTAYLQRLCFMCLFLLIFFCKLPDFPVVIHIHNGDQLCCLPTLVGCCSKLQLLMVKPGNTQTKDKITLQATTFRQ